MNLLQKILAAAQAVPAEKIVGVTEPVGEGEKVIGHLNDPILRGLHHHIGDLVDAANAKNADIKLIPDQLGPHDRKTCHRCQALEQFEMNDIKHLKVVKDLFWASLHEELPEEVRKAHHASDSSGIGLRNGWEIVALAPRKDDGEDLLGGMLIASLLARG